MLKAFGLENLGIGSIILGFIPIAGRNNMYWEQSGKGALVLHVHGNNELLQK